MAKQDLATIRKLISEGHLTPPWVADLHAKQREAFYAVGNRALQAGRRGGKTTVGAAGLVHKAYCLPGKNIYIASTGQDAKDILWETLTKMNRVYHLGAKLLEKDLTIRFASGGSIILRGADQENFVDKVRGKAYRRAIIDEPGSFNQDLLQYLIEEALDPALADYEGDLWLTGTPNPSCTGFFHDVCTGENPLVAKWQTYHWTLRDNPCFAGRAERILQKTLNKHNWAPNNPKYLREWEGQWIRDIDSLIYRFDRRINLGEPVKEDILGYIVAVDLGSSETEPSTAFAVLCWTKTKAYVIRSWKEPGLTPSDIGERLRKLRDQYHPIAIVVDQGGLGAGYIREFVRRFQLPAIQAEKSNKLGFIELMNGDLRNALLLFGKDADSAAKELEFLPWNKKRNGPPQGVADHLSDAVLYGWRQCQHYLKGAEKPPEEEEDPDEQDSPYLQGRRTKR